MRINLLISCFTFILVACGSVDRLMDDDYVPMAFSIDGNRIVGSGIIDGTTLDRFREASESSPESKVLVLQSVGGSVDDEANVIFSQFVRDEGFYTIVPSDGLVASGGTDLFLAGSERVLEPGACVGVHSWSGGDIEGSDLPEQDPEHRRYLDYYEQIGINPDFYWFTLQAAPADGMHWITTDEANQFMMTTAVAVGLSSNENCDLRLE